MRDIQRDHDRLREQLRYLVDRVGEDPDLWRDVVADLLSRMGGIYIDLIAATRAAASAMGISAPQLQEFMSWVSDKARNLGVQQPVVAAVVTSPKGVLVGRRNDRTPPWTFIAGEQEPCEQPADTITREVKEETGLDIRASEVIGERDHPRTGRHMIYMAARPVRGIRVFVGDEAELAEVRWASLTEAEDLLPGMYEPVHDYLSRSLKQ